MLQNITKINQIFEVQQLKQTVFEKRSPVFSENSLVNIKVLDTREGMYKLLINGSVFQSKIAMALLKNDELFARVLSNDPLTLRIDSLFTNHTLSKGALVQLLSRLGIEATENFIETFREIVKSGKPLIKSRLSALNDFVHSNNVLPDYYQMSLLASIYLSHFIQIEEFLKRENNFIKYSIVDVIKEIYAGVKEILESSETPEYVKDVTRKLLCQQTEVVAGSYTDVVKKMIDLSVFLKTQFSGGYRITRVMQNLSESLVMYLLQKALYNQFGLYPDFHIYENRGGLLLFLFTDILYDQNGSLSITLNDESFIKDNYKIGGALSGTNLHLDIFCREPILENETLKTEIENRLAETEVTASVVLKPFDANRAETRRTVNRIA